MLTPSSIINIYANSSITIDTPTNTLPLSLSSSIPQCVTYSCFPLPHYSCSVFQYARVMGMRVVAVDVGMAKSKQCLDLGAEAFVDAR